MPRPGRGGSDQKLLDAARAMLPETGVAGLRLRAVARRAGVNLGMFHYHFGSKREFTRRLLQDIYEEFFGKLSLESQTGVPPSERLRRALIVFGRFARDQRAVFIALLSGALHGDKSSLEYLKANAPRHIRMIAGLLQEGRRAGEIKDIPIPVAVAFALGGMGAPNVAFSMMERLRLAWPSEAGAAEGKAAFLSDQAIEQRADMILSALTSRTSKRRRFGTSQSYAVRLFGTAGRGRAKGR